MKKIFIQSILLWLSFAASGQGPQLNLSHVTLPKDSMVARQLIFSLNGFLRQKDKPHAENTFVWPQKKTETFIEIDELHGIEKKDGSKDEHFYKPQLNNIVRLNDSTYLTQISYIGLENNTPSLKASFDFIAHKTRLGFLISSPLSLNTKTWKTKTIHNCTFHYKVEATEKALAEYEKKIMLLDKKLGVVNRKNTIYLCENFPEVLHLVGVNYKADYSGVPENRLTCKEEDFLLIDGLYYGDGIFDPHDLWHDRMANVLNRDAINKPVDEGCAYLFGGSGGITWREIFKKFEKDIASNKNLNWLEEYGKFRNFGVSDERHLFPEYVINALLVKKIEKEKGFNAVIDFLSCGKYENTNENYFKALEKATGITRSNFNREVWNLVLKEAKWKL